jgi:hypothetical protein
MINLFYYLKGENIIVQKIILIGYCKKEFLKSVQQLIKTNQYEIKFINFKINLGKYYIFNEIGNMKLPKNTLIWYMDHDIYPDKLYNNFQILKELINLHDIGIVAFNQKNDIRHQYNIYFNETFKLSTHLVYPEEGDYGSIALGSFVISSNKIKILCELDKLSVYGMDDYYMNKLFSLKKLPTYVLKEYFIIHPFDKNLNYKKWKLQTIQNLIENKLSYEQSIQSSINFWS